MERVSWGHGDGANKPGMKCGRSKAGRKENGTCGFRNSVLPGSCPTHAVLVIAVALGRQPAPWQWCSHPQHQPVEPEGC